jgi:hypothetical protein
MVTGCRVNVEFRLGLVVSLMSIVKIRIHKVQVICREEVYEPMIWVSALS